MVLNISVPFTNWYMHLWTILGGYKAVTSHPKVDRGVTNVIADMVWNKSRDIRDCVRICKLARSAEGIGSIVETFLSNNRKIDEL